MPTENAKTPNKTPAVARIVLVRVHPEANNGADVAPAVITRVWDQVPESKTQPAHHHVNVRVLYDGQSLDWWTSIPLFDSAEAVPDDVPERFAYWGF